MFEALIITLREGVEAALILAIAISVLRRGGHERAIPALFGGTLVALAASVGVAVLATRVSWNEDLAEGWAMLVGSLLVASLVVWMWRSAPHFKREIESSLSRATTGKDAETATSVAGVFLFAFSMVFREGVETAIFLAASSFNSEGVGRWLGALAGLGLAIGFGVLFVRGTVRVPLKPFFSLTSAVLLLIAVQLFVGGLHELSEAEVIPSSRAEMAIVGPLVKNELLVFALTVAIAAAWLLFGPRVASADAADTSGPQARLARASRERERSWRRATGIVGLLVVAFLSTAFVREQRLPGKAPAQPVALEGDHAQVDVTTARDGHLHFYETTTPEGPVRFFVLQVDKDFKVCADACEICGDKGYFENGSSIVCRNCTAPIARATIGRSGGCNPIPIPHQLQGDHLTIAASDLRSLVPKLHGK